MMQETEQIEERVLTAVRVIISIAMVVMLWCAMCGYLS